MGSILRHHSPEAPKTTPQIPQAPTSLFPLPSTQKVQQKRNQNGPSQTHQFNEYLLYEKEFHGDTFVSAHLQRLQHGLIDSPLVHGDRKHVTFVAVEFCFHPPFEHDNRFKNATIEVTASRDKDGVAGEKELLRFVKYAPHLAFGRISSESLKWNFQLGAKLGVTEGPVDVSVNPSGSYERDRVVGTMMKIQGTTRSVPASLLPPGSAHHNPPSRSDLRDRRIVWSLEENDQQQAGLPREFTFVFLVEQPHVHGGKVVGDMVVGDVSTVFKDLTIGVRIKPSITGLGIEMGEHEFQYTTVKGEIGQRFCTADEWRAQESQSPSQVTEMPMVMSPVAVKDTAHAAVKKGSALLKKQFSTSGPAGTAAVNGTSGNPATTKTPSTTSPTAPQTQPIPIPTKPTEKGVSISESGDGATADAIATIFAKASRSASVAPQTGGTPTTEKPNLFHQQPNFVQQQQKGRAAVDGNRAVDGTAQIVKTATGMSEKSLVPPVDRELFNFALMEGSFEDLIELPGNAVTSVQPSLGAGEK